MQCGQSRTGNISMFTDTDGAAQLVFGESTTSLMAHTIRAVKKIFSSYQLDLDVRLVPDSFHTVLGTDDDSPISILSTRCHPIVSARGSVVARIFINPNATRHLARFCIAHEIYHLLMELKAFVNSALAARDRLWPTRDRVIAQVQSAGNLDRETAIAIIEGDCNKFARKLCNLHHDFRTKHTEVVLFPDGLISGVINIGKLKF